ENPTYGTSRVLAAYRDLGRIDDPPAQKGLQWLAAAQHQDGGWGGAYRTPVSIEETALATEALFSHRSYWSSAWRGVKWLLDRIEAERYKETAPIGFYFAKLWYAEALYPLIFTVAALRQAQVVSTGRETERGAVPFDDHTASIAEVRIADAAEENISRSTS
ncbi:MAG TPA: squalene--hopene cyclase, partial [Planctomycetaceae bacterium]|nr:squalene--hopene cyclase [Planctomycetaceae bacterium]